MPVTALATATIKRPPFSLGEQLPGGVLWGGAYNVQNALSPWTGFALLCGYAVVLIGAAAWRLRRADA